MKHNWVLIAALLAILAVPFALALFEDAVDSPAVIEPEPAELPALREPPPLPPEPPPEPATEAVVEWERSDPSQPDAGY